MTGDMKKVIFASALGSIFECYDFWVYAMMAPILGPLFFPGDSVVQIILALSAMSTTSLSRPMGGLFFGHIGDRIGRKKSFMITLVMMGASTFGMGLLPTYSTAGIYSSIMLVILRIAQGIALGGEFSGASIYIAEHGNFERRGFLTALVLSTSGIGAAFTALVLFILHSLIDDKSFVEWGWRVPFLLSFLVFLVSLFTRLKVKESPVFEKMAANSELSDSPIHESFGVANRTTIFWALVCVMLGESGITQGDYIIFLFLVNVLKVDMAIVDKMLMYVYLLHVPVLIFFGYLSDKVGRKPVLMMAFLITVLFYLPGFRYLVDVSYPAYGRAIIENPIIVHYSPSTNCNFGVWEHFVVSKNGSGELTTCQELVRWFGDNVISFSRDSLSDREYVSVGTKLIEIDNRDSLIKELKAVGYLPGNRDNGMSFWKMVLYSFMIMIPVSMVFGTCGAALLDMFPPRIRFTSVAFVYNMGHGLLGGLVPVIVMYSILRFGSIYSATYYTILAAFISLLFGTFLYPKHCHR